MGRVRLVHRRLSQASPGRPWLNGAARGVQGCRVHAWAAPKGACSRVLLQGAAAAHRSSPRCLAIGFRNRILAFSISWQHTDFLPDVERLGVHLPVGVQLEGPRRDVHARARQRRLVQRHQLRDRHAYTFGSRTAYLRGGDSDFLAVLAAAGTCAPARATSLHVGSMQAGASSNPWGE